MAITLLKRGATEDNRIVQITKDENEFVLEVRKEDHYLTCISDTEDWVTAFYNALQVRESLLEDAT